MREKKSRTDLTVGTVWKKLLVFFLPIAAGTVIQQLYNAADGSSAQIINVLVGFFVAMTAGASLVIGQIYGGGGRGKT